MLNAVDKTLFALPKAVRQQFVREVAPLYIFFSVLSFVKIKNYLKIGCFSRIYSKIKGEIFEAQCIIKKRSERRKTCALTVVTRRKCWTCAHPQAAASLPEMEK